MKWILTLVLALTLGLNPRAEDPAPKTLTCPTCEGNGSALQDCVLCVGGEVHCRVCSLDKLSSTLDEVFAREEGLSAEDAFTLEWGRIAAGAMALSFGGRFGENGFFRCPASCEDGVSAWNNKKCKYCKGEGQFRCEGCPRSVTLQSCACCKGKGSTRRLCEDCLGSGQLPDPTVVAPADAGQCGWCDSLAVRACTECDEGSSSRACSVCLGEKSIRCDTCLGTTDKPCLPCKGTGKALRKGGKGVKPCKSCKQKGRRDCTKCEKGRLECPECEGAGELEQACVYCLGNRMRPCLGCFRGQYRYWEVSAQLCEAAGDFERAVRAIELAVERTQVRFEISLEWFNGDEQAKKHAKAKLEAERDAERKRLGLRLKALRASAEEPR